MSVTLEPSATDALRKEVARRRTFAIISHPDAGKTTLTEKTLLYAGAIELAGAVRGRKAQRAAAEREPVEHERGVRPDAQLDVATGGDQRPRAVRP